MKQIPDISFVKTAEKEIGFEVFMLKSLLSRKDELSFSLSKPHRVQFYHIIFIIKGSGEHFVDFKKYRYTEGSILFISKGQVHAFDVTSGSDGLVLLFTEDFLSKNLIHSDVLSLYRLYNYHFHLPILHHEQLAGESFVRIIHEIYDEYTSPDMFAKEEMLSLLVKLVLLKAERVKQTLIPQQKNAQWFIQFGIFRTMLEKHFAETRSAKEYARKMHISYKHLNEICKSLTGKTAKEFIDSLIILEIKRYLATSDMPIQELTYTMGFDEPTNLVKFFKKHTGKSPVQFRNILTK